MSAILYTTVATLPMRGQLSKELRDGRVGCAAAWQRGQRARLRADGARVVREGHEASKAEHSGLKYWGLHSEWMETHKGPSRETARV